MLTKKVTPAGLAGATVGVIVGALIMLGQASATEVKHADGHAASKDASAWRTASESFDKVLDTCSGPANDAHNLVASAMRGKVKSLVADLDRTVNRYGPSVLRTVSVPDYTSNILRIHAASVVYASNLVAAGECTTETVSAAAKAADQFAVGSGRCIGSSEALPGDEVVVCDGKAYVMPK